MITLPQLPYAYDALQPVISPETLHVHHDKHHRHYVDETNRLAEEKGQASRSLEEIIQLADEHGWKALHNNAAQAWNHAFFWTSMTPARTPAPARFAGLKDKFVDTGAGHFGSGWVWIVLEGGQIAVRDTHDAGNFVGSDVRPLLVCDLWEHAYYLDHKNDREGFLKHWWDGAANWKFAEQQLAAASQGDQGWTFDQAA